MMKFPVDIMYHSSYVLTFGASGCLNTLRRLDTLLDFPLPKATACKLQRQPH